MPQNEQMVTLTAIVPATNQPPTLRGCLAAIRAAAEAPEELLVVDEPPESGPAKARNTGAQRATGDVLVFVDADVEVHADAFERVRRAFDRDETLTALFGSYDDAPAVDTTVSAFRNLLHYHVHQQGAGPATTFWAGLGAIRRAEFLAADGFDEEAFPGPSIEDVELGMRLAAAGHRIELDPRLQGKHLKAWTLGEMVSTDLWRRGAPWVALLLRSRSGSTALNLGWVHRLSAAASVTVVGAVLLRRPLVATGALAAFVALNARFYLLLLRRRGPLEAVFGVGLHALHHLTSVAAVPIGVAHDLRRRARRR